MTKTALKMIVPFLVVLFVGILPAHAADNSLYVISIDGEIGSGMYDYFNRCLSEIADEPGAVLLLELNTYGGYVDTADDFKEQLLSTDVPTICFVKDKALSAGALIALSCDRIYMSPGSNLGAAEPRVNSEKADAKTVAYWSAQLRGAAEANGRDGNIAAAMADSDIVIEGLTDKDKLVSLTADEAVALGMADGICSSRTDIMTAYGLTDYREKSFEPTGYERLAQFLTSPVVAPILLTVGIAGIALELLFVGGGVLGSIGGIALALYFVGGFVTGAAGWLALLFFLAALILLILEIFVIPGFGVAGILGIISMFTAIVLASGSFVAAFWQLLTAIVVTVILIAVSLKWKRTRRIWHRLILSSQTSAEAGYNSQPDKFQTYQNLRGRSVSELRPAGVALLNGERVQVETSGEFVEKDRLIEVIKVDSVRIVVREIKEDNTD